MTIRLDRINHFRESLPVPACLLTDTATVAWLTRVELDGFWLLITRQEVVAFAPTLLADQVQGLLKGMEVIKADKIFKHFIDYSDKKRIKKLGVDFTNTSHRLGTQLAAQFSLTDVGSQISAGRMVKDREEIRSMRIACKIAAQAFDRFGHLIKPGMTEIEIMYKIEEYFAKNMARPSFPTIVASGPNSANPHHISAKRAFGKNDIVLIDAGCVFDGYCSDLTRTFFLGKINGLQQEIYTLVDTARKAAISDIRPGKTAAEIDASARGVIAAAGYADSFIHSTGHGIGRQVHEEPRVSASDKTVLRPGMAVTVEPGVYLPAQFGVRIEDTVLVTNNGCEVLTR